MAVANSVNGADLSRRGGTQVRIACRVPLRALNWPSQRDFELAIDCFLRKLKELRKSLVQVVWLVCEAAILFHFQANCAATGP